MVKERVATVTDETVTAPIGMAAAMATTATTTLDERDGNPLHLHETNLSTGRCPMLATPTRGTSPRQLAGHPSSTTLAAMPVRKYKIGTNRHTKKWSGAMHRRQRDLPRLTRRDVPGRRP